MRPSASSAVPFLRLYNQQEIEILEDTTGVYAPVIELVAADNSVNKLKISAASTGNDVLLESTGDDPDVNITMIPKGTGVIQAVADLQLGTDLIIDSNGNGAISLGATANAVNSVRFTNADAGNTPIMDAFGTDPDIDLQINPKGTGKLNTSGNVQIGGSNIFDVNGNEIVGINAIVSAVNNIEIQNAVTGNSPMITVVGDDDNVNLVLTPKGSGLVDVGSSMGLSSPDMIHNTLLANVQTTDATVTNLTTATVAEGGVVSIEVDVIGRESDGSNRAQYKLAGLFYRNAAGNVTQQGATTSISTIESDDEWNCDLVADTGTQTIDVEVTGKEATIIDWYGAMKVVVNN